MSENFRDRLMYLLKAKDISQRQLAIAIKKDPSIISRYLSGEHLPGADVLQDISDFFNVSVDYLLGKTDDPSTSEDRKLLNAALNNPAAKMSDEVKETIKHGILQTAILLPYIEKLDVIEDIKDQINKSEKRMIVPEEIPLDFATPVPDDKLEPEYLKDDILLCRLYKGSELPNKGVGLFFRNTEIRKRIERKDEFETVPVNDILLRKFMVSENNFIILSIANPKYGIEDNNIVVPLKKIETEYKLVAIVMGIFRVKKETKPTES